MHLYINPQHTAGEIRTLITKTKDEGYKTRLRGIQLALKGTKRSDIAIHLSVNECTVTEWVHRYNEGGLARLASNKGGRPRGTPKWSRDIFTALGNEIKTKKGYWTIPRMQEWIRTTYNKEIPEQTVWYRIDQANFSYKSARPSPIGGSEEKRSAFKKRASHRS
jgi:transposase